MMAVVEIDRIDTLVQALRAGVPGSRVGRGRELIAEIRDGLDDAATAYQNAGLDRAAAERRAVDEFGDPAEVARQCSDELGATRTLRAAVIIGLGYPLVLGCWQFFYAQYGATAQLQNGHTVGRAFTLIGTVTLLLAVLAAIAVRVRSRLPGRPIRPAALAFGVLALISVGLTYGLALVSHPMPGEPAAQSLARDITQDISLLVSAPMVWAAVSTLLSCRRPAIARSSEDLRTNVG